MIYYTNLTKNDLLISDIGITIRAGQTVNPYQLNPLLSQEQLRESEMIGGVYKAILSKKISKSNTLLVNKLDHLSEYMKESNKSIPSRVRAGIMIDPKRKQYIEELTGELNKDSLSKFEDYADGFAEPEMDELDGGAPIVEAEVPADPQTSRYVNVPVK